MNIGDILGIGKDPNRKEIETKLRSLGITDAFTINKDYSVDINKDISIMVKNVKECPVDFNVAHGNFIWHFSDLSSMKNLPKIVKGNLVLSNNKITSFKDCQTTIVTGQFNCSNNNIKSLNGGPQQTGDYIAIKCELDSLEGAPDEINGNFVVMNNNLTNLDGAPTRVKGLFDCSNNKIKDWSEISKLTKISKRVNYNDNLLEGTNPEIEPEDPQIHIEFPEEKWKVDDEVIYNKPGSKWHEMKGLIASVDTNDKNETTYQIKFLKLDNPDMEKEYSTIKGIKGIYIRKWESAFDKGDLVIYRDSSSKFNGFRGKIEIDKDKIPHAYKIRMEFDDNPGLTDVASQPSINKGFLVLVNLKPENIQKYDWKSTSGIQKDPSNNFREGEKATYLNRSVYLLNLKTPFVWNVEYEFPTQDEINHKDEVFSVHCDNLTKIAIAGKEEYQYKIGDPIIVLDPDGEYDECKGTVTYAYNKVVDVDIIDKFGQHKKITNIGVNRLELDKSKLKDIDKKQKFKKDAHVVYVANLDDEKNIKFHLCKGIVTSFNDYGALDRRGTYDVRVTNRNGKEETIFWVKSANIKLQETKFEKGDKVVYNSDDQYDGQVATIMEIKKNGYEIQWRDEDNKLLYLDAIEADELTKFVKPIGSKVKEKDIIVFTKPESKHFGCKGVIKEYDPKTKEYKIEITNRDKKISKISKVREENLELAPPKKVFKVGDRIRYINSESPHDGLIGKVEEVKENDNYKLLLKNSRGDSVILTTTNDNIILLEEAEDTPELKFGDYVKYIFPGSKFDGRIGTFEGTREKDGVTQWTVKLDDDTSWLKLHVDAGTLHLTDERPAKKTTTTYNYTAPAKKKKKKEKPKPRKPVLVYNRRYVARKAYKPREEGSVEEPETVEETTTEVPNNVFKYKRGDKVRIKELNREEKIFGSWMQGGEKRYSIQINNEFKQGGWKEDELEFIKEKKKEFEINDKVKIIADDGRRGQTGKIFSYKVKDGNRKYTVKIGDTQDYPEYEGNELELVEEKETRKLKIHDRVRIKETGEEGTITGTSHTNTWTKYFVNTKGGFKKGGYNAEDLELLKKDYKFEEKEEVKYRGERTSIFSRWKTGEGKNKYGIYYKDKWVTGGVYEDELTKA
jgi:hypothetical protein